MRATTNERRSAHYRARRSLKAAAQFMEAARRYARHRDTASTPENAAAFAQHVRDAVTMARSCARTARLYRKLAAIHT